MGGKHGKYVYVERSDGWYVKVRALKSRDPADPEKYVVVGPKTRKPPITYKVLKEEEVPEEARKKLYEI